MKFISLVTVIVILVVVIVTVGIAAEDEHNRKDRSPSNQRAGYSYSPSSAGPSSASTSSSKSNKHQQTALLPLPLPNILPAQETAGPPPSSLDTTQHNILPPQLPPIIASAPNSAQSALQAIINPIDTNGLTAFPYLPASQYEVQLQQQQQQMQQMQQQQQHREHLPEHYLLEQLLKPQVEQQQDQHHQHQHQQHQQHQHQQQQQQHQQQQQLLTPQFISYLPAAAEPHFAPSPSSSIYLPFYTNPYNPTAGFYYNIQQNPAAAIPYSTIIPPEYLFDPIYNDALLYDSLYNNPAAYYY